LSEATAKLGKTVEEFGKSFPPAAPKKKVAAAPAAADQGKEHHLDLPRTESET
jgi:hypothetical protein